MRNLRLNFFLNRHGHRLTSLFWECTLRCNLNCLHCGSDCRLQSVEPDMPFEKFEPVLRDVAATYDPHRIMIITTGGEPLLRPDIVECGRKISQMGFKWGMVTNGMLLDEEKLHKMVAAGLRSISVSLDGFEEDHNWFRNHPESFRRAERAIKAILAVPHLTTDVITCVNQRNYPTLSAFRDYLISIGVRRWRIFTVVPMGRAANNPELQLPDELFRPLMDFIVENNREGKIHLEFSCEGYLGEYENKVRSYPFFCMAGVNVASILSDGSISGCLSIRSEYHQGNVFKGDNFVDVWEHGFKNYRNRKWMKNGSCKDCKAWSLCQGGGMHLRNSDGTMMRCNYLILNKTKKE